MVVRDGAATPPVVALPHASLTSARSFAFINAVLRRPVSFESHPCGPARQVEHDFKQFASATA